MDEAILKKISRRYTLDADMMKEFLAFDDIVDMKWELPSPLSEKDYVIKFVDPSGHDAEKVACNIFDTWNPKWDIFPFGPGEKDAAEELERFLEWHMYQANSNGEREPFRELMRYSARYNRCAAQMEYLPYWLRGELTDDQKEILSRSPFRIYVHDPKTVYYERGSYGLRWVASVSIVPAAYVIDYWEAYQSDSKSGKAIQSAIAKVEKLLDDDEEANVVLVDYTDNDKRYVCCWLSQETSAISFDLFDKKTKPPEVIDILNTTNELGWINWEVAVGSSDPLLASLHRGDLWVNSNKSGTIKRTTAFRRAFFPLWVQNGVGEAPQTDYTGDQDVLQATPGTQITAVQPPPLDAAFQQLSAEDRSLMAQSTNIQALAGVTPSSNVQYATVQAFVDISVSQLAPYARTVEKILSGLGYMMFRWLKKADKTEVGYRMQNKSGQRVRGEKFNVGPEDFDIEKLFISVKLIANKPTDKLQQVNMMQMIKQAQLPIPDDELMEGMGFGHPKALEDRWEEQQIERAAMANFIQTQQAQSQLAIQQEQTRMQLEAQARMQQSQPNQNGPQTPPAVPGGEGMNPANGGTPPAMAAAEMTQTAIQRGGG